MKGESSGASPRLHSVRPSAEPERFKKRLQDRSALSTMKKARKNGLSSRLFRENDLERKAYQLASRAAWTRFFVRSASTMRLMSFWSSSSSLLIWLTSPTSLGLTTGLD